MIIYITVDEDQNVIAHKHVPADYISAIDAGNWFGTVLRIERDTEITEYLYDSTAEINRWIPVNYANESDA